MDSFAMRVPARLPRKLDVPKHPRFQGFEAFAAREILPHIAGNEVERRALVGRAKVFGVAAGLTVLLVSVLALFEAIGFFGFIAIVIVTAIGGAFAALWPLLSFASNFNELLLRKTCEHLKLRFTGANADLPVSHFRAAYLVPGHDKHRFEDGIEDLGSDAPFAAGETILMETNTDTDGDSQDVTVWRGLLVEMPVLQRFEGKTLVFPDRWSEQAFESIGAERITLGVGELEDGLDIRTTLPAEARAVLTPRVMRRLTDAAQRLGPEGMALAFVGSSVLVSIKSGRDRFRGGSVFKPIDLTEQLDNLLADIVVLFDLAEAVAPRSR